MSDNTQRPDTVLLPFLQASDDAQAQHHLQRLMHEHAEPIISGILRRKLGAHKRTTNSQQQTQEQLDEEELRSDIRMQVLEQLQKLRHSQGVISQFSGYVAVTAYHTLHLSLRKRWPERHRLENQLRYLLTHCPGLELWQDDRRDWIAGFAVWHKEKRALTWSEKLPPLLDNPSACLSGALFCTTVQTTLHPDGVAAIFNWVGHPLALPTLVMVMADLCHVTDTKLSPIDAAEMLPHPAPNVEKQAMDRSSWRGYWEQIGQLPAKQRAALLLHARDPDGNCLLELFELEGIVSLREIAETIGLSASDLAQIWNDLPWDDARIAQFLEVTPQYCARLRMIARQRLANLQGLQQEPPGAVDAKKLCAPRQ